MNKNICVYCSSSNSLDEKYYKIAYELGSVLAKEGCSLVYGGSTRGCMGKVAQGFLDNNGKVTGIIPQVLNEKKGIENPPGAEIIVTKDMNIRKQLMEEKADVFLALPGSFGTLDEIIQVIVTKQLSYHKKAIIFLDVDNFYEPLFDMFENFYKNGFAKDICRELFFVAKNVNEVVEYCKNYVEKEFEYK